MQSNTVPVRHTAPSKVGAGVWRVSAGRRSAGRGSTGNGATVRDLASLTHRPFESEGGSKARRAMARPNLPWRGEAIHDGAIHTTPSQVGVAVWQPKARRGRERQAMTRRGLARNGKARRSAASHTAPSEVGAAVGRDSDRCGAAQQAIAWLDKAGLHTLPLGDPEGSSEV